MDWLLGITLTAAAYLAGSLPAGFIIVRLARGVDIRQVGSKNMGALNAFHQAGAWAGLTVLLVDAGKGALAVLGPGWVGAGDWVVYATTTLVVVGHNWPVFLRFRGGKGAASILGISLAMLPYLTLIALAPMLLLIMLTRNMVIGVGVGVITLNALTFVTGQEPRLIALCVFLSALVTATYIVAVWGQISDAIRTRQWRGIFYGENMNP